ncbi:MAG TPA: fructosamine kinase family protein [Polyangiaceae bacterium]|nr:fructosamine kinase family protein [Polyangiaceae bacterium]
MANWRGVAGGDINEAYRCELDDGSLCFLKANPTARPEMFEVEALGLKWLREAGALRVPEVLACSRAGDTSSFLMLEWLEPGRPSRDFDDVLGRGLAKLHAAAAPEFGLDHDNFIGSLPQENHPTATWAEFFWSRRLEPQLRRAVSLGRVSLLMRRGFQELERRIPRLLGEVKSSSRLHGDLWSGNVHVDDRGEPCLIDPAAYGGHREVDLAMLRLFGGTSQRVFDAYAEALPLETGAQERVGLYQLYPLLVHVNLFGGSYVSSVERALKTYV